MAGVFEMHVLLKKYMGTPAFECDDVIRRAHVSKKQRAAGHCIERSRMGLRYPP